MNFLSPQESPLSSHPQESLTSGQKKTFDFELSSKQVNFSIPKGINPLSSIPTHTEETVNPKEFKASPITNNDPEVENPETTEHLEETIKKVRKDFERRLSVAAEAVAAKARKKTELTFNPTEEKIRRELFKTSVASHSQ